VSLTADYWCPGKRSWRHGPWIFPPKSATVPNVRIIQTYESPIDAVAAFKARAATVLFRGDCLELIRRIPDNSVDLTIASPPYCMGKPYEKSRSVEDFIAAQKQVLPAIARITKDGGSICWEIGYHVFNGDVYPLDYAVFSILKEIDGIVLRNRIVWTYGHGEHARKRFSGRHETVMWFTKGSDYTFDLDAVREPQKYPGKRKYNGPHKGEYSSNPKGKNPSDVWSIPNVKAKHVEKLRHPCQFPIGLADRLVRALCPKNGLVFDPYMGSGSSGVAAILNGRWFVGAEINKSYMNIASRRLAQAYDGTVPHRPVDRPIFVPGPGLAVARRPEHFVEHTK
jgi:adenine-specific DNA-methyltransferase